MIAKQVDKQGRLVLGPRFANQTVLVDDSDETHVVITLAKTVPAHEVWLYQNEEALQSVLLGLDQARKRQFSKEPPNVEADLAED